MVPVLRAGLILLEAASTLLPVTQTYHVGYRRDEATLEVRRGTAHSWEGLLLLPPQRATQASLLSCTRVPGSPLPDHPSCRPPTPQASCYLNKLPKSFDPGDLILVSDPMLATGAHRAAARAWGGGGSAAGRPPGCPAPPCSGTLLPTSDSG